MVSAIDESVGRLVAALQETGMYADTLIVFTSDNGSGYRPANLPLRGRKGSVFEVRQPPTFSYSCTAHLLSSYSCQGGVRVPAFLHGPPLTSAMSVAPGTRSQALAHITDWLPTLLGLAGGESLISPREV